MALIEINKDPSPRDLRWFGVLGALFFALLGGVVYLRGSAHVATLLWEIGLGFFIIYYAVRRLQKPIFLGWIHAVFPIGWLISHLVLGITYYLVLTPIGLIMRLTGRDPLRRRLVREAESYWVKHRPAGDPARYFRQF